MTESTVSSDYHRTLATLRQFVPPRKTADRCDLCGAEIPAEHPHLVEPDNRRIACSCDACAILFPNQGDGRFRRIPRETRELIDFRLSDAQWDALLIPINMAFFFACTPSDRVIAMYPGPAGATESLLSFRSWSDIVEANPVLKAMQPDTEALLVNRLGDRYGHAGRTYYLVPIDQCYRLVGLIRAYWRGLSGGREVWEHIKRFYAEIHQSATPHSEVRHA